MSDTTKTPNTAATNTVVTPPTNGAEQVAKRVTKPREVPTIVLSPDKAQHAVIKAALDAKARDLADLGITLPLSGFALMHALRSISNDVAITAMLKNGKK